MKWCCRVPYSAVDKLRLIQGLINNLTEEMFLPRDSVEKGLKIHNSEWLLEKFN